MTTVLSRLIAILLVVVTIFLFTLAIWNAAFEQTFLNPDVFKKGLGKQDIYADIIPVAVPALLSASDIDSEATGVSIKAITETLPADDWRAVSNELVPPEWLQTQVERMLDLFFAWVNGDTNATYQETIDFQGFADRLTGEEGQVAVQRIIDSAPSCTDTQIDQLRQLQDGRPVTLPICNPPETYLPLMHDTLSSALEQFAAHLGDENITLAETVDRQHRDKAVKALPLVVDIYRQLGSLFFLCPAALLALVMVLVVRSFKGFGRWIGGTLVAGGLIAIAPLPFISMGIVNSATEMLLSSTESPEIRLFQLRLATGLVSSIFQDFATPIVIQAGLMAGIGVVIIIISMVMPTPQPEMAHHTVQLGEMPPSTSSKRRTVSIPNHEAEDDF
jgi:hypothetical protein